MSQYFPFKFAQHIDNHLILPILAWIEGLEQAGDSVQDVIELRLRIVAKTNMIVYAIEQHAMLHGDAPNAALINRKKEIVVELRRVKAAAKPLLDLIGDDVQVEQMRYLGQWTMDWLVENKGFKHEQLEHLWQYIGFIYHSGNYEQCASLSTHYKELGGATAPHYIESLWSKLQSEILMNDYQQCHDDILALKNVLDTSTTLDGRSKLSYRTTLVHYAVWISMLSSDNILLVLMNDKIYSNVLQTTSSHLLPYYIIVSVIHSSVKGNLSALSVICQQQQSEYSDELTKFVVAVDQCRFEDAQTHLSQVDLSLDFFASSQPTSVPAFVEAASALLFKSYVKIHQCIDLGKMPLRLPQSSITGDATDAERYIVGISRQLDLDAVIDSDNNHILMTPATTSVYATILEKGQQLELSSRLLTKKAEKAARYTSKTKR